MKRIGIFNVEVVRALNGVPHGDLVKFYDSRYSHTPAGQFVTSYYASSLLGRGGPCGLRLDTRSPDWHLTADEVAQVLSYINEELT